MKIVKLLLEYPGAFTSAPDDEIEKNREDYQERRNPYKVIDSYIQNGSKGNLDLNSFNCNIDLLTHLPENLTINNGSLNILGAHNLKYLPKGLKIEHYLDLGSSGVERLPEDLDVNSIKLINCKIKHLPENLVVPGSLHISNCPLKFLPNNLKVGVDLMLYEVPIKYLADNLHLIGDLIIYKCRDIKYLPKNLNVEGTLNISHSGIKEIPEGTKFHSIILKFSDLERLPNNFSINESLDLVDTNFNEIPYNLTVKGSVFLNSTPLAQRYTSQEIRKMIEDRGGSINGMVFK